jgi:hypothetical protein
MIVGNLAITALVVELEPADALAGNEPVYRQRINE